VPKPTIEPRVLKGFRDYLPNIAIARTEMISALQSAFSTFGFVPIDTPALEYSDILLGKGSDETDRQLFRFTDQGGRDVAMRFDLTVPLARFAAMNINELGTPFRRYHIAPVWRAEKPQRGRYREFVQCDFDIIGTRSVLADAEIVAVIHFALNALKIGHRIRLNNRSVLNGFLAGLGKVQAGTAVLRAIDKIDKLGEETVTRELNEQAGLNEKEIGAVFEFLKLSRSNAPRAELLAELRRFFAANEAALKGVDELSRILSVLSESGLSDEVCRIDLSIARGLDYYTGSVFETVMTEMPEIGSICSGGRYDNLAGLYTNRDLPGVGASIGLDRILGAYEALDKISGKSSTAAVFVTILDEGTEASCMKIANTLRENGVATELALEVGKLGNQLKYAGKKGIRFAVIAGKAELEKQICSVKNLDSGEQTDGVSAAALAETIRKMRP